MAQLDITILGQNYKINCPEGEQNGLLNTVAQVDEHLKEMKVNARSLRNEQLVVMAALNYRHQLNKIKEETKLQNQELNNRIKNLQDAINGALATTTKTE